MCRVHLTMRTEGITAFSNRYGVVVWTGENDTKTISVDVNLFENSSVFFENGLVWTGPQSSNSSASSGKDPGFKISRGFKNIAKLNLK